VAILLVTPGVWLVLLSRKELVHLDGSIVLGVILSWIFVLGYLLSDPVVNPWLERLDERIGRLSYLWKANPKGEVLAPGELTSVSDLLSFDDAWRMVQTDLVDNILIKTKRSKKRKGLRRKMVFVLDARMAVSPDIRKEIVEYDLGGRLIYDSLARKHHTEQMKKHQETTKQNPGWRDPIEKQALGFVKFIFRAVRVVISATRASLAVRVTVASLLRGAHIECRDLNELCGAEQAIEQAGEKIRDFIDVARTFDGREEIRVF
jgi:hypothetical protein